MLVDRGEEEQDQVKYKTISLSFMPISQPCVTFDLIEPDLPFPVVHVIHGTKLMCVRTVSIYNICK